MTLELSRSPAFDMPPQKRQSPGRRRSMTARSSLFGTVAASALLCAATPVWSQTAPAEPGGQEPAAEAEAEAQSPVQAAAEEEGAIVVTGSRVARSGFDAPTPTKVLSSETMEERGL